MATLGEQGRLTDHNRQKFVFLRRVEAMSSSVFLLQKPWNDFSHLYSFLYTTAEVIPLQYKSDHFTSQSSYLTSPATGVLSLVSSSSVSRLCLLSPTPETLPWKAASYPLHHIQHFSKCFTMWYVIYLISDYNQPRSSVRARTVSGLFKVVFPGAALCLA